MNVNFPAVPRVPEAELRKSNSLPIVPRLACDRHLRVLCHSPTGRAQYGFIDMGFALPRSQDEPFTAHVSRVRQCPLWEREIC
jgi:hypothetical protein